MSAVQISDNVYSVGVKDPDLKFFDIIMKTEYGTTYNAYLVKGEKVALIDTVKEEFSAEYLANIQEVVSLEKIEYLIVNHTEPDHSGAISLLLARVPSIKVICSASALPFVKNVINANADITSVKDDETIDLGGKTLRFKLMPYMHWPDTMMDYLPEDKILFSNDGFAAHISSDSLYADEVTIDVDHEVQYYWDMIMRPYSAHARRNLLKLDGLDIEMIAPSHGPIFRKEPRKQIDCYKEWAVDKSEGQNIVTVFYASSYGNTKKLADAIATGLEKHGFTTAIVDVTTCATDDAREMIEKSKAVVIGTPTFNGDAVKPIWDLVNLFSTVYSIGKRAAVFGSYGWGGEGVKLVAQRLSGLRLKVFDETFRARLVPSDSEMYALNQYITRLAEFFGGGDRKR